MIRVQTVFAEIYGLGRAFSWTFLLVVLGIILLGVFWFVHLAPPSVITITSGPPGSIYLVNAERFSAILARNGVRLNILPSQGSVENLKRLIDPAFRVDVGFVQGGVAKGIDIENLVSLGSLFYQPLLLFYRGPEMPGILSGFKGKRLAIGQEGSGTHTLALALLADNEIKPGGPTVLEDLEADNAAQALIDKKIDAAFLMGDVASLDLIKKLLHTPGIRLLSFAQSDAYSRRIVYLSKLDLPRGAADFGKDLPSHTIQLIGPTVELVARESLHPAISDLLLEAAQEIYGRAGIFKRQGEFPAPLQHEFPISNDALRYYKSGKTFLYRYLPFGVASLVNRIIVIFVPILILLIPAVRIIPSLYGWRIRMRIFRWYGALLILERDLSAKPPRERKALLGRLDSIENSVNKMKIPASFADQFYALRQHISFVRDRLEESK